MTPALRALLERHPAPWKVDHEAFIVDAHNEVVLDTVDSFGAVDFDCAKVGHVFVDLVNSAAEVERG